MKFKIFGLSEKYYKIVTAIFTIVVTLGCFVYYDGLDGRIKQNADESAAILKNNYTANNPFAWEDLD